VFVTPLHGVRGIDSLLHDVARTSGTTRLGAFVFVTVPGALPSIVTGIRIAAAVALLAAVTAEFVTGNSGIGAYMQQQRNALEPDDLYAAVVLVGALGYGIGFALQAASRRFVFWAGEAREEPR
jgi:ABC-type nitrate/sulfonate/bicarbonate transport system permease component